MRLYMALLLKFYENSLNQRHIDKAVSALDNGDIILIPTETGYCYAGKSNLDSSYIALLELRQAHPKTKPFSILCKDLKQVSSVAEVTTPIYRYAAKAFPGPYTFILKCNRNSPQFSKGTKRKTIGVRVSGHPVTALLMENVSEPLVITSVTDGEELIQENYYEDVQTPDSWWVNPDQIAERANSRMTIALEWEDFVPMRVSTVIDFSEDPPRLIREGGFDERNLFGTLYED
jgi:tRNA threonylcarbamoyl adenosine modification protein (Sua5/YciO/YrdC/YwlC family)